MKWMIVLLAVGLSACATSPTKSPELAELPDNMPPVPYKLLETYGQPSVPGELMEEGTDGPIYTTTVTNAEIKREMITGKMTTIITWTDLPPGVARISYTRDFKEWTTTPDMVRIKPTPITFYDIDSQLSDTGFYVLKIYDLPDHLRDRVDRAY